MCFSAMVWADYRSYTKRYGAQVDIGEYIRLLELRDAGARLNIPRFMTSPFFDNPQNAEERYCRELADRYDAATVAACQAKLFEQRHRLAEAEIALAIKATKTASEEKCKATNNINALLSKLAELKHPPGFTSEGRIFAGVFCPVMVMDNVGNYIVRPMRYQCRVPGMPASADKKYPGTYNAKRSNLTGFWRTLYGRSHAIMMTTAFYENVSRYALEHRPPAAGAKSENLVLRFSPDNGQLMQVAALWSHWRGAGEPDLLSFAVITDEAPPEVADTGHERCIVPLQDRDLARWLAAAEPNLSTYASILDNKERPYYRHAEAA